MRCYTTIPDNTTTACTIGGLYVSIDEEATKKITRTGWRRLSRMLNSGSFVHDISFGAHASQWVPMPYLAKRLPTELTTTAFHEFNYFHKSEQ